MENINHNQGNIKRLNYPDLVQQIKETLPQKEVPESWFRKLINFIESLLLERISLPEDDLLQIPAYLLATVFAVKNDPNHYQQCILLDDHHYSVVVSYDQGLKKYNITLDYSSWFHDSRLLLTIDDSNYKDFVAAVLVSMIGKAQWKEAKRAVRKDGSRPLGRIFKSFLIKGYRPAEQKRKPWTTLLNKKQKNVLKQCTSAADLSVQNEEIYYKDQPTGLDGRSCNNREFRGQLLINSFQDFLNKNPQKPCSMYDFLKQPNSELLISYITSTLFSNAPGIIWAEMSEQPMRDLYAELMEEVDNRPVFKEEYAAIPALAIKKISKLLKDSIEKT